MNIIERLGNLRIPRPSIIDVAILGILGIPFMSNPFLRGSYFIFYSIFLFCLSLAYRPKNNFRSTPIVILLITSLALIFAHRPYRVVEGSIINSYFNVAIMSEGFIYILAGAMLFITIVRYSSNAKLILILAGLVSIIPIKFMLSVNSPVSLGLALLLSIGIYLILHKKTRLLLDFFIVGMITAIINWNFMIAKATSRPQIWLEALRLIKQHPFLGRGFNQTVMPDGLIPVGVWGWVYVHNVFLTVWMSLGIIGLIAVLWFIIDCLRSIKKTVYLIPFLFIVFLCNFKEIMLLPERALIVIVVSSCCVRLTLKKEKCDDEETAFGVSSRDKFICG
jgi:hypothetical protein